MRISIPHREARALRRGKVGSSTSGLPRGCVRSVSSVCVARFGGRNIGNFSKSLTEMMATVAAQRVASSAVPTIAVGRVDPAAARIAIAVVGINCTELVLARGNVHIAFVATPGREVERFEITHRTQA